MRVMRLCKREHDKLDGIGASITGGRWNSKGRPVVYTSSTASLCVLEYMVHLSHLPENMVLLEITIPDTLKIEKATWTHPEISVTRRIGDEWLNFRETAVLCVPTVLIPGEFNYLLNPEHPLFGAIEISNKQPFAFDPRLLGASSLPSP